MVKCEKQPTNRIQDSISTRAYLCPGIRGSKLLAQLSHRVGIWGNAVMAIKKQAMKYSHKARVVVRKERKKDKQ